MKKIIAMTLCLVLVLSLAACGNNRKVKYDLIPMVMVDGELYLDTGYTGTYVNNDDTYNRVITSTVDGSERPSKDDQSNFGTGFRYRYGEIEGTIEIEMNNSCCIFATEEVRKQIQFPDSSTVPIAPEEPGAGSYTITIGKMMDDVHSGEYMLSEEETAEVMTAIALSADENGWVNDVTRSAPSCKVLIRDLLTVSTYNYSAYDGIFNDLENIRSLKLTDEARNTVNTIFENYVSMAADEK